MNPYAFRRYIVSAIFVFSFLIYIIKLFYLQIIDDSYKYSAENNSRRFVTQYPARGLILDRKGKLIVDNMVAYDLMVTPNQVKAFDTTELCNILQITPEYVAENIQAAHDYSVYKPSLFLKQISGKTYAVLQEKLYKYPGFFVQTRTLRNYERKIAAHLLGYVGEVDEKLVQNNAYYKGGDYIGISGMEKSYEAVLRGKKGVNIYLVDVHNRVKGSFQNGKFDTAAVVGSNLVTTIDADLQEYGEYLMQKMRGSVVAIEPATGEILAMVSMPNYDPSLLVGRIRSSNYKILEHDSLKPLFFRPVMANYPPGSTFKVINGIIGMKEGVLFANTTYSCHGGYNYGGPKMVGCHNHSSPLNLPGAVQNSCNTYFCYAFRSIIDNPKYTSINDSYNAWRNYVMSMGYGRKLNTDIPNELNGNVPSSEYYDRFFGVGRWKSSTIISLAIGQAELGITPLQMANMVAAIANRGYYYTPHIVKKIEGQDGIDPRFLEKHVTPFDTSIYNVIIKGMEGAVNGPGSGTALRVKLPDIIQCGKTGTAQNPHGENHSVFIAFAPKDNPKIAIMAYIENAGYGATWAAPVASLMIEKYLKDTISRPELVKSVLSFKQPRYKSKR
jgi:penicillin-binding protein 2